MNEVNWKGKNLTEALLFAENSWGKNIQENVGKKQLRAPVDLKIYHNFESSSIWKYRMELLLSPM
jgi:hypothetical protein